MAITSAVFMTSVHNQSWPDCLLALVSSRPLVVSLVYHSVLLTSFFCLLVGIWSSPTKPHRYKLSWILVAATGNFYPSKQPVSPACLPASHSVLTWTFGSRLPLQTVSTCKHIGRLSVIILGLTHNFLLDPSDNSF